ncbi:MAG: D-alanyl-D-alanine carboxypeptidase [Firmicutes bacterium]|nr:D-alanyl-D-alanine carboxypeptidase [Bacillota bacterium]
MMNFHKCGFRRFFIYWMMIVILLTSSMSVYAATPEMPVDPPVTGVLMEPTTGQVFREVGGDTRLDPYGLLNLLIALTAFRHADLTDEIIVPEGMLDAIPDEAWVVYLEEKEELTVQDCISAILFNSANDASYALAIHLAGSEEQFVQWMNETAKNCGAVSSHFVSVFNIQNDQQYTTARDMSKIAAAFWKEVPLRNLLCEDLLSIPPTNLMAETRYYANPFELLQLGTYNYYEYAVGGKASEGNIIAFAQSEDMTLLCTIMNADDNDDGYEIASEVLDYGFQYFQPVMIEYPGESIARIPVYDDGEKIGYVDAIVKGTFLFYAEVLSRKPIDPEGLANFFTYSLELPDSLTAPVHEGDVIGQVIYTRRDDPSVNISLSCIAGTTLESVQEELKDPVTSPGSLANYLSWFNLILIPIVLYLAWRLLWPSIVKRFQKPKSF